MTETEFSIGKRFKYLMQSDRTIHDVVLDGDLAELKRLLQTKQGNVNEMAVVALKHPSNNIVNRTLRSGTPMHVAAYKGNVAAAELLLLHGGQVDCKNGANATPLHCAATAGQDIMVTWLINHGVKVDSEDLFGETTLLYAMACDGNKSTAEVLITADANVNHNGLFGYTPLHWAAKSGSDMFVQLLLDNGADPHIMDKYGKTALDWIPQDKQGTKRLLETYLNNDETHRRLLLSDDLRSRRNSNVSSLAGSGVSIVSDVTSLFSDVSLATIDQSYAVKKTSYRGVAVIINNQDFSGSGMCNRDGSQHDRDRLHAQLATLGLDVHCHENLSASEMGQCLTHYSRLDHGYYNCFICCVLSHGREGKIYGVDGSCLTPLQIASGFVAEKCPSLRKKPKVFILVACKGPQETNADISDTDAVGEKPVHYADVQIREKDLIPLEEEDFLVAFSTIPDHVSYRHPSDGTKYVNHLTINMSKYGDQKCFSEVLRNTEKHLIEDTHEVEDGRLVKQVCSYSSTLRHPFILKRVGQADKYKKPDNSA